jgi:UDP-N-acetyl-D-mannosaminuronate dehydrogenase
MKVSVLGLDEVGLPKVEYISAKGLDVYCCDISQAAVDRASSKGLHAFRRWQVAIAEELRMECESLRLDFEELRAACNNKWNVDLLESRDGIGGHCLPKDIHYLAGLSEENMLLNSALEVDRRYRDWLKLKREAAGFVEP